MKRKYVYSRKVGSQTIEPRPVDEPSDSRVRFLAVKIMCCLLPAFLVGFDHKPANAQNCALEKPPHTAAVTGNHGRYYFTFPRIVSPGYTGCQSMWDEKGVKFWVLTFQDGKLKKSEVNWPPGSSQIHICTYRNDELSDSSPKDCPSYESSRMGFNREADVDLKVPPDRDPRK